MSFHMHILLFLFVIFGWSSEIGAEDYQTLSARVRSYLQQEENDAREFNDGLPNSNKIGLGYNPLMGSPVCFTGDCQMEEFRRPIFKLTYSSSPEGSCTSKLIPDHIDLDCLPSSLTSAQTDQIDTLQQLKETTSSGIDISASVQGWGALSALSFSYGYSKQTTHMIDNIVKQSSTMFFSSAKVSYVKLSMFEPTMTLSDKFIYVIENMPCCTYNSSVQRYVYDFIIDYFGFAYIHELMLGGIAQDLMSVRTRDVTQLESENVSTKHEAKIGFYISMGTTITSGYDKFKQDKFMSKVQSQRSTRLGGDPSVKDLDAWAKTIPDNPVVSKFTIRPMVDLLTSRRFPSDVHITDKVKLIEKALNDYANQPPFCYNNCTNSTYGTCVPTGTFNVGKCQCKSGFEGVNCSSDSVPLGTLCGVFSQAGKSWSLATCGGRKPQESCPSGYNQYVGRSSAISLYAFCYKAQMDNLGEPAQEGAWCGDSQSNIPCGTLQAPANRCPPGYENRPTWRRCYKQFEFMVDLRGTLCGIDTDGYTPRIQVPCGGIYASMNKCPINFQLSSTTLGLCYKM